MLPWLIFAILVLVGLYLVARWFVNAPPADILRALTWVGGILLAVGVLVIALTGRWNFLWALLFPMLPLLFRLRTLGTMRRNAQGPSRGQSSQVDTRFLRMTLDHDTGDMDGEVREGDLAGRRLSELELGELVGLWRLCAAQDEQSRSVLESYLDRSHPDWRDVAGAGPADGGGGNRESPWAQSGMSVDEAREILGVGADADEAEIEAAYRQGMKRAHPDQGGSDWMAAKMNQAKDVLLKR